MAPAVTDPTSKEALVKRRFPGLRQGIPTNVTVKTRKPVKISREPRGFVAQSKPFSRILDQEHDNSHVMQTFRNMQSGNEVGSSSITPHFDGKHQNKEEISASEAKRRERLHHARKQGVFMPSNAAEAKRNLEGPFKQLFEGAPYEEELTTARAWRRQRAQVSQSTPFLPSSSTLRVADELQADYYLNSSDGYVKSMEKRILRHNAAKNLATFKKTLEQRHAQERKRMEAKERRNQQDLRNYGDAVMRETAEQNRTYVEEGDSTR